MYTRAPTRPHKTLKAYKAKKHSLKAEKPLLEPSLVEPSLEHSLKHKKAPSSDEYNFKKRLLVSEEPVTSSDEISMNRKFEEILTGIKGYIKIEDDEKEDILKEISDEDGNPFCEGSITPNYLHYSATTPYSTTLFLTNSKDKVLAALVFWCKPIPNSDNSWMMRVDILCRKKDAPKGIAAELLREILWIPRDFEDINIEKIYFDVDEYNEDLIKYYNQFGIKTEERYIQRDGKYRFYLVVNPKMLYIPDESLGGKVHSKKRHIKRHSKYKINKHRKTIRK